MPRFLTILLVTLVIGAVLWPSWSRRVSARHTLDAAGHRLDEAVRLESHLADLRARLPAPAETVAGDVAALVQAAVRELGLPAQTVAEVSPQESPIVIPAGGTGSAAAAKWKRQAVQVRLNPLPLADIGAFLQQLRATAPAWLVSQVELRAEPRRAGADSGPEAAQYALSCRLTRTTLDKASP